MLAAALGRNARCCAFHKLQQSLLNALTAHVAGNGWVFRLAANLVDFVDINDPALGLLDVIIGCLKQLQNDILDIFADITRLG